MPIYIVSIPEKASSDHIELKTVLVMILTTDLNGLNLLIAKPINNRSL